MVERAGVDLDEISTSTTSIRYLDRQGDVIHEQLQPYRFTSWNTIYRSLLRCFGRERYLLGHEMVALQQRDGRVHVVFANQADLDVDLVIGADGVGSHARSCLLAAAQPIYAGYVAWRGLVPERELGQRPRLSLMPSPITFMPTATSSSIPYQDPMARSGRGSD